MTSKVSKKKLQERFFGTQNNELVKLNQDISDVFFLFEELREHVNTQEPNIVQLEETIQTSKQNLQESILPDTDMTDKLKHFYYAFIGGSMASVILLYNPYIGIGAISTGFIAGSLFSYFKK